MGIRVVKRGLQSKKMKACPFYWGILTRPQMGDFKVAAGALLTAFEVLILI
jgi:hypothetical protein